MTSYTINQTSRTASTVVIAGILASQLLAGEVQASTQIVQESLYGTPYHANAALPSFDQVRTVFGNVVSGEELDSFVESVSSFYSTLVVSQESLDAEFSRVLHENLWDLYER